MESGKNICNKLYQNAFCFEINQDTLTTSKSDAPQSFEVWFLRRNNYSGSYQVNQNYPKQRKLQLQCGNESNLICAQLSWDENRLLRIHVFLPIQVSKGKVIATKWCHLAVEMFSLPAWKQMKSRQSRIMHAYNFQSMRIQSWVGG